MVLADGWSCGIVLAGGVGYEASYRTDMVHSAPKQGISLLAHCPLPLWHNGLL
jgi:hypothetical protein